MKHLSLAVAPVCFVLACSSRQEPVAESSAEVSTNGVSLYNSDRCDSDLIANIGPTTNCDTLRGASAVWGIKVRGQCFNVDDLEAVQGCRNFKAAGHPDATFFYNDDRCGADFVAAASPDTDCRSLSGRDAWGISQNGACENISDMNIVSACERFKGGGSTNPPSSIPVYSSETCSGTPMITVTSGIDCGNLGSGATRTARSARTSNGCMAFPDTTGESACMFFRRQL